MVLRGVSGLRAASLADDNEGWAHVLAPCSTRLRLVRAIAACFQAQSSYYADPKHGLVCARDARVEAKAARRDDRRAREASPDVVRLPGGGDPMGGGDGDSFQAAQARCAAIVDEGLTVRLLSRLLASPAAHC